MVPLSAPPRPRRVLTYDSGEEKPHCINCQRQGETCDYSIRLNWDGRTKKKDDGKPGSQPLSFDASPTPSQASTVPPLPFQNAQNAMAGGTDSAGGSPHAMSMYSPTNTGLGGTGTVLPPLPDYMSRPNLPTLAFDSLQPVPPLLRNPSWQEPASNGSIPGMNTMPPLRPYQQTTSYPSPADSAGFGSPHAFPGILNPNASSMQMPPPLPTSNPANGASRSPHSSNKRVKLSPREDSFLGSAQRVYRSSSNGPGEADSFQRSDLQPFSNLYNQGQQNPLTPASSSTASEELHRQWQPKVSPKNTQQEEVRRVSVNSLLSGSPEPEETRPKLSSQPTDTPDQNSHVFTIPPPPGFIHRRTVSDVRTETYGLDRGLPDLDLPRNNDTGAISGASPSEHSELDAWLNDFELAIPEFGFGLPTKDTVFAKGGYYASPVAIKIPRKLEPLPSTLLENPMNLLYFHHFLNHTARILVPHDCSENPFKTILPQSESTASSNDIY